MAKASKQAKKLGLNKKDERALEIKFQFLEKLIDTFQAVEDNNLDMKFWKDKVKKAIMKKVKMDSKTADTWIKQALDRVKK